MKAKTFQFGAQQQSEGSPAITFEEQLKEFLARRFKLRLEPTPTSPLVAKAPSNAAPRPEEPAVIVFHPPLGAAQRTRPTWDATPPENMNCED